MELLDFLKTATFEKCVLLRSHASRVPRLPLVCKCRPCISLRSVPCHGTRPTIPGRRDGLASDLFGPFPDNHLPSSLSLPSELMPGWGEASVPDTVWIEQTRAMRVKIDSVPTSYSKKGELGAVSLSLFSGHWGASLPAAHGLISRTVYIKGPEPHGLRGPVPARSPRTH